MRKVIITSLILVMVLGIGLSYAAFNKEIPDNGKHFNMNIIGVPKDKKVDMKGTQGNTIFVPLGKDGGVGHCVINVARNYDNPSKFEIADRNATDQDGALILVPFEDYGTLSFNVYAIALGKPGGPPVHVEATAEWAEDTTADLLMTEFDLKRETGKPKVVNISNIFRATGWIDNCAVEDGGMPGVEDTCDTHFTNVWVFNIPTLLDYYWDYYSPEDGLRHMQVRFYQTESGSWTNIPE